MSTTINVFTSAPPTGESPATDDTAPIPEAPHPRVSGRTAQNVFIDGVMERLGERGIAPRCQIKRMVTAMGIPWVESMEVACAEAIATKAVTAFKRDGSRRTVGGVFFETAKQSLLASGKSTKELRRIFQSSVVATVGAVKEELEARIREAEARRAEHPEPMENRMAKVVGRDMEDILILGGATEAAPETAAPSA